MRLWKIVLIVRREGALDTLEIKVKLKEDTDINSVTELEAMKAKIADRVKSIIQIKSKITLVEPKSIARSEGKAKRVIDLRKI